MRTLRGTLPIVVCLVAALASAQTDSPKVIPAESIAGVDFSGLSDEQKKLATSLLNEGSCDCGCGMRLARCRRDDSKCGKSLAIAGQIIADIKQGKTREEILRSTLSPPSKFVEFPLDAGSAPSIGPVDAKVTILHYLDFQ